nr:class I SAM-dependent methyltransferase [Deinococcus koreensis]
MAQPGAVAVQPGAGAGLTAAQRSNFSPLTALGYSSWRRVSLGLLAGEPFGLRREAALFRDRCRPAAGQWWLDAGTSTGFYAGVLAAAGCRVLAADLSPAMLREGARQQPAAEIDWAQLNIERSDLPADRFDGVTVGATLNETHDPARFLRELARVIRPGGQLWLMYLQRTGGPLQALLARPALGGLSFPDPAWVARQLPGCALTDGLSMGAVRFERYQKAAPIPGLDQT